MLKKILVISGAVFLSTMLLSGCIKKKPKPIQKLPESSVATISDLATPSDLDSNELNQTTQTTEATTVQTIATTAAPTTAAPVTNPAGITMAEYNKLKDGMSYQQVVNIIGGEGKLGTSSSYQGYTVKGYSWSGETNPNAFATIVFSNGKLSAKTQIGL